MTNAREDLAHQEINTLNEKIEQFIDDLLSVGSRAEPPSENEMNLICQALIEAAFNAEPKPEQFHLRAIGLRVGQQLAGNSFDAPFEEEGRAVALGKMPRYAQIVRSPDAADVVCMDAVRELIDGLASALGMRWLHDGLIDRPIHMAVSRANYGKPSSIVIEFRGSPARFTIFMSGAGEHPGARGLMINGKSTRSFSKTHAVVCDLIDEFIAKAGVRL